jgi:DNA-binding beta-propeller fold protein YncE
MGGNGIAVIDLTNNAYIGTVTGLKSNIRHITCNDEELFWSTNKGGFIQKIKLSDLQNHIEHVGLDAPLTGVQTIDVGEGVRTIALDPTSRYIFAAANNDSKVVVVRASDLSIVATCDVDSYPVGMDISEDGHWLITTSQERENGGGRCVCVFHVRYNS